MIQFAHSLYEIQMPATEYDCSLGTTFYLSAIRVNNFEMQMYKTHITILNKEKKIIICQTSGCAHKNKLYIGVSLLVHLVYNNLYHFIATTFRSHFTNFAATIRA